MYGLGRAAPQNSMTTCHNVLTPRSTLSGAWNRGSGGAGCSGSPLTPSPLHLFSLSRAQLRSTLSSVSLSHPNSSSGQLDEATAGGSSEDLKDGRANHNKNEEAENHRTDRVAAGLLSSRFGYLPSLEDVLLELGTFVISQSL